MKNNTTKPTAYIPEGAKINLGNLSLDPPETTYEKRKKILKIEHVKKLTGGEYGND